MRVENLDVIEDWMRCYEIVILCDGLRLGVFLVVRGYWFLEVCVENVEIVVLNWYLEFDVLVVLNICLNVLRRYLFKCNFSEMEGLFCIWV